MLSNIVTSNTLQNLSYGYDKFGNFEARKDNLRNLGIYTVIWGFEHEKQHYYLISDFVSITNVLSI